MNNNRRIAKNTLALYGRMLFSMVVSLYTSRVILNTLGIVDFGVLNVVGGVVAMFGFLNGSMAGATSRFLTIELGRKDYKQYQRFFSTTLLTHLVLAMLVVFLAETIGLWFVQNKLVIPETRRYAALWVYQFSVATAFFAILQIPYSATIIAHEYMTLYAYVGVAQVLLRLVTVITLTLVGMDKLIFWAMINLVVSIGVQGFYYIYVREKLGYCRFRFEWDKSLYRKTISYSGWDLLGCMSAVAQGQGLNILLNIFFSPAVNAARAVAYQVQGSLTQFVSNFMMAARPQIIKDYAAGEKKRMVSLVFYSARLSFYLLLFMSLPLMMEMDYVLKIWLKNVPEFTRAFAQVVLLLSMVQAWRTPFITAMHATGKIKIPNIVCGSLLISTLPVCYVALKLGSSPVSVFIISLVLTFTNMWVEWLLIRKDVGFSVWDAATQVVGRCALVGGLSAGCLGIIKQLLEQGIFRFLILSAGSVVVTGTFICWIGVTSSERQYMLRKIKSWLGKYGLIKKNFRLGS